MRGEIEEEKERFESSFVDNADIIRHTTKVHSKDTTMSEDYIQTRWTDKPKEANFVQKAHLISDRITDFICDKEAGLESSKAVRREANNKAILFRNDPNNWLLRKVFGKTQIDDLDKENDEEQKGFVGKAMDGILGKKNEPEKKYE